ncbi:MAG: hypothetical protein JNL01_11035 [Bdellovibrionales bacterium]|nr:hypothetical protein [Bdellovibrionales bacterium]
MEKTAYRHHSWKRQFCQVILIWTALTSATFAQDEPKLPDIRARSFDVSSDRASKSGRVYLMNDLNEARPFPGRILLLREGKTPIMAFRVLRNYPEKKKFAARVVRRYPGLDVLPGDQPFMALEKVSDLGPMKPTQQDRVDLSELEKGMGITPTPPSSIGSVRGGSAQAQEYDPELDAGSSPPPSGDFDSDTRSDPPSLDETIDQLEEEAEELVVDEIEPLETHRSSFSLEYGLIRHIRSRTADGDSQALNSGVLLRYGLNLGRMILIRKHEVQDTFTVEGGMGMYTYGEGNQRYSLMSNPITVRYTINFNNNIGFFAYGGILLSNILSAQNASDAAVAGMSSPLPAGGIGILGSIGPSWNIRIDAGFDMLAFGLMLSF